MSLNRLQNSNNSIQFKIIPNFDRSEKYIHMLEKIEIKYGCEGIEGITFSIGSSSDLKWILN
jgi:hypothetical protein